MAIDDAYQRLYGNQGPPGYNSGSPGGVATQNYGSPPASAWGGSPIDLTGGSNYASFSQGYPDQSQAYNIFPGASQGYPQGYSQYPGGNSQYPGGYSQYPGGNSQYPGGYSQGYPQGYSQYPGGYSPGSPGDFETDSPGPTHINPTHDPDPSDHNTHSPTPADTNKPKGGDKPKGEDKPPVPKPPDVSVQANMDTRLDYVKAHFSEFDTGADIGKADGKFSVKDLNKLKDGQGQTAEVAKELLKDDVIGKLGGDDGKISTKDIEDYRDKNNTPSDGQINADTKQQTEGDCGFLSTTRGISQTDTGRAFIKQAIKANDDGSYDVKFAGADKTYHVSKEQSEKGNWAKGDIDMQVLGSAADDYFKENGEDGVEGKSHPQIAQLLTGSNPSQSKRYGGDLSQDDIKKELLNASPEIGKSKAVTLYGGVGDNSSWKATDTSHVFQIESVDKSSGTVTYTNPWDSSVKHTISVDDLSKQIADNEAANVEITTF